MTMFARPVPIIGALALALLFGCNDKKKSEPAAGGETATPAPTPATAPATATDTPPAQPEAEAPPAGAAAAAGEAEADPAKVEVAANTALKIMVVVSSAVRGAKGDCASMKQKLAGVMTVAQKWRDQLAEQYKVPGVNQGVHSALAMGKLPELLKNLVQTRDGARACPELVPEVKELLEEID